MGELREKARGKFQGNKENGQVKQRNTYKKSAFQEELRSQGHTITNIGRQNKSAKRCDCRPASSRCVRSVYFRIDTALLRGMGGSFWEASGELYRGATESKLTFLRGKRNALLLAESQEASSQ